MKLKTLVLLALVTVSCLLNPLNGQSINFVGATKHQAKKQLKEYGFTLERKSQPLSRLTAISAYNEDARAFGLYIFVSGLCIEAHISFFGQSEAYWWEILDGPLYQVNDYTWIDSYNRQLYVLYYDPTLEEWVTKITPY